jgi:hypothetical protein
MSEISYIGEHPLGQMIREHYPEVEVAVFMRGGHTLFLSHAVVPLTTQSKSLFAVLPDMLRVAIAYADYAGYTLVVDASPYEPALQRDNTHHYTTSDRLARVYARYGFKRKKKLKRLKGDHLMSRRPNAGRQNGWAKV